MPISVLCSTEDHSPTASGWAPLAAVAQRCAWVALTLSIAHHAHSRDSLQQVAAASAAVAQPAASAAVALTVAEESLLPLLTRVLRCGGCA